MASKIAQAAGMRSHTTARLRLKSCVLILITTTWNRQQRIIAAGNIKMGTAFVIALSTGLNPAWSMEKLDKRSSMRTDIILIGKRVLEREHRSTGN